jgi:hypothetical protein
MINSPLEYVPPVKIGVDTISPVSIFIFIKLSDESIKRLEPPDGGVGT